MGARKEWGTHGWQEHRKALGAPMGGTGTESTEHPWVLGHTKDRAAHRWQQHGVPMGSPTQCPRSRGSGGVLPHAGACPMAQGVLTRGPPSSGLQTALVVLVLPSLAWLLALLAVNSDAILFHYLFAISNCLQVPQPPPRAPTPRTTLPAVPRDLCTPPAPAPLPLQLMGEPMGAQGWVRGGGAPDMGGPSPALGS